MTTTLAPVGIARPRSSSGLTGPLADIWAMTRRNLVHISREPMQLSDVTLQPLLFTILFVYIFGGAIPIPGGGSYVNFLLAGILALNMVTSTMGTAVGSQHRPARRHDRSLPLPADVAVRRVGRSLDGRPVDVVPVRADRCVDGAGGRVASRSELLLDRRRVPADDLLRLLDLVGDGVRRTELQEPRIGGVVRLHRACSRLRSSRTPWCPRSTCRAGCRRSRRGTP